MMAMCAPSTYGMRLQILRRLGEVVALVLAELFVDDLHEVAAVVVGAAIVHVDDDVAVLREPLLPAADASK